MVPLRTTGAVPKKPSVKSTASFCTPIRSFLIVDLAVLANGPRESLPAAMRLLSEVCVTAAVLLAGCSTPVTKLPPISTEATGMNNPGQVIWHDLATRDLRVSQAFYGQLFGWEFDKIGLGARQYTIIRHRGKIIGGMFKFEDDDVEKPTGEWLVNLSTTNVDNAVLAVENAGGRIIEPAQDFPDRGRAAFVSDNQEALFIITQSSSGDPLETEVPLGGWLWNELWTRDHDRAKAFYESVFSYGFEAPPGPRERAYSILTQGGKPKAALLELQTPDVRPHWVPFVRVLDVEATVALAKAMQANVILEPDPAIRDGKVALLQGPTGEPFVVQSYDFE